MNPFSRKKPLNVNTHLMLQESRKRILTNQSDFFVREAYNALRTNVLFSLTGDEKCKVIVVTSSGPGEGKSTTALNFSINLAKADKKVLLIDADMRRPRLNRLLGVSNSVGLSNVIMNAKFLKNAIITYEESPNLHILFSGSVPPNPSELLTSRRMQQLLETLQENYDYIIVDTPPINLVTDAIVLSPKTNGVLFVVRAGICERGALADAIEQLEYAQAKILGYVLNGIDSQSGGWAGTKRYGNYEYRRGYGYGYGYKTEDASE